MGRRYWELIKRCPLRPIRSDAELNRAVKIANELAISATRTRDEEDYLDVLSGLIEKYEDLYHPIDPVPEGRVLSLLIEQRGVTQQTCARETGIANSTISEVVRDKRCLTRQQVAKLCNYFSVSPLVFMAEATSPRTALAQRQGT